jgi:DNA (cytosine-5)-methyltransferase 1
VLNVVACAEITILGVCSGLGWLEFAVAEAFRARGYRARVVCHCEREAVTAALLGRLQDATGDAAPIWDDLSTFDGRGWRGAVDCLVAGLPCPAYSLAGKQLGNDDERAWGPDGESGPQYHFLRLVEEIRPGLVYLENVPQFVSGGHFRRLGDGLLRLGYLIPPAVFLSAEDVGATQKRERVYVLAYRQDADRWRELATGAQRADRRGGLDGSREELGECAGGGQRADRSAPGCSGYVAESDGLLGGTERVERGEGMPGHGAVGRDAVGGTSERMGSAAGNDEYGHTVSGARGRGESHRGPSGRLGLLYPPGRGHWTDPEWVRVLTVDPSGAAAVEPGFSVVVDGMAVSAADLLRIGGNGVVPMAAAVAFDFLLDEVGFWGARWTGTDEHGPGFQPSQE